MVPAARESTARRAWAGRADENSRGKVQNVVTDCSAYRMDEIPIPLRQILTSNYPSDAEVLNRIQSRVIEG